AYLQTQQGTIAAFVLELGYIAVFCRCVGVAFGIFYFSFIPRSHTAEGNTTIKTGAYEIIVSTVNRHYIVQAEGKTEGALRKEVGYFFVAERLVVASAQRPFSGALPTGHACFQSGLEMRVDIIMEIYSCRIGPFPFIAGVEAFFHPR